MSWSWGEAQTDAGAAGGGGARRRQGGDADLHVSARISKAGPQLLLACAAGTHIKSAVLSGRRKAGKSQAEFLTFSLSDVLVSGYQTGGADGRGPAGLGLAELRQDRDLLQGAEGQRRLGPAIRVGWDRQEQQGVLTPRAGRLALRRRPVSGAPVRADASRPARDARDPVRAASPRRRRRCRVLELGCGDGGNLVPMALALPGARFVGIDAAPGAIARGRGSSARSGWRTSTLEARCDRGLRAGGRRLRLRHRARRLLVGGAARCATACSPSVARALRRPRRRLRQLQRAARRPHPPGAARHAASSTPPGSTIRASASSRRGRCCASWSRARRPSMSTGR